LSAKIGLRVDVDTLRGTRQGVPQLLRILDRQQVRASFFFSVGPDNMGRNLWRLLKPAFLIKMLRSGAPSLYGWDILLRGTAWPGPQIGPRCREVITAAVKGGHEIGLHAWDHFTWQHRLDALPAEKIQKEHRLAHDMLAEIAGQTPSCAAAPGWKVNAVMLKLRDQYNYAYASDCRGESMFRPLVQGRPLLTPQIPATLPTFDEIVGQSAITLDNYNAAIMSLLKPEALNTYTIHAEVEGIVYADLFAKLLTGFKEHEVSPVPLGALLPPGKESLPEARIERGIVSGRADWVSVQAAVSI